MTGTDVPGRLPGGPVEQLLHASRLLGGDPFLVLHGGGNSSVKDGRTLRVKGSGHDLATLGSDGLAVLDRGRLAALLDRDALSDTEMVQGFAAAALAPGPAPSIEALVHHTVPHRFVLHSHADAVVTLTDTRGGTELLRTVLGPDVLVLPYCRPGFDLARLVRASLAQAGPTRVRGIVLAHHGLFTFDDDALVALTTHLELVGRAATFLEESTGVQLRADRDEVVVLEQDDSALRRLGDLVRGGGDDRAVVAARSPQIQAFCDRDDLPTVTQRGPSTLEHVIHTQRVPLLGWDVDGYVEAYRAYFTRNAARYPRPLTMLDPVPRVILDPGLGLVATGPTPARAYVALEVYRHTMRVITAAEGLGGYVTTTESQSFDIEYWELEQAKLRRPT